MFIANKIKSFISYNIHRVILILFAVSVLYVDLTIIINIGVTIDMVIQSLFQSIDIDFHLMAEVTININITITLYFSIIWSVFQRNAGGNVKYGVYVIHEVLDIN